MSSANQTQIAKQVVESILAQKLAPGERLGEQELADLYGVSRTLVREALMQLQARGFVEVRTRKGWYVVEPSIEQARDAFAARRAVEAGMLRVLAAGTRKRVSYLPEIPTAAEAGLPGYEVTTWFALFAPAGTPRPVVEWLNAAVREMNADPAAVRRLTDVNIDPMSMTVYEFGALVKADAAKWERIIRDAGLKPE